MKKLILGILPLLLFSPGAWATETLTVYCYDSFAGKGSLGEWMTTAFASKANTKLVKFGSAGEALTQLLLEGPKTPADILVGVDGGSVDKAVASGLFAPDLAAPSSLAKDLWLEPGHAFVPFDFGYLAMVYDDRKTAPASGLTLAKLAAEKKYRRQIVLEDPRTSSIGLAFFLWTVALSGETGWQPLWRALSSQILTLSPGWSGAYGLFLKGEAPFVMSYSTSPAYHIEKEKNAHIRALIFPEGHYRQVEGVGIVKATARPKLARQWVALLLSAEAQKQVPLTQWMYPARDVPLPASFAGLPKPTRAVSVPSEAVALHKQAWLREWAALMASVGGEKAPLPKYLK